MHKYQMEIKRWFGGYEPFVIEAENKADALAKAKQYVCQNPPYCWVTTTYMTFAVSRN